MIIADILLFLRLVFCPINHPWPEAATTDKSVCVGHPERSEGSGGGIVLSSKEILRRTQDNKEVIFLLVI